MKRAKSETFEVNADAFLDTVANLVGVLVILVVVVASQTKIAATAAAKNELKQQENDEVLKRIETVKNVQDDLERQLSIYERHQFEIALRKRERDQLMIELVQEESAVDEIKKTLDEDQTIKLENAVEIEELQQKIAALLANQGELESAEAPNETITLQHLPTPMAKTVFGDEVHILLENEKVSVIPWDTLIESLKSQARLSVTRAIRNDRVVDALGPVDGFVMKYALKTQRGLVSNGAGASMAQNVELEYFVLEPTEEVIRENIDAALQVSGRLRSELALHQPRSTTVTVWVYPNSFGSFRKLKERLFVEGYLTAARPLPEGIRVGASPQGSNSSAQ